MIKIRLATVGLAAAVVLVGCGGTPAEFDSVDTGSGDVGQESPAVDTDASDEQSADSAQSADAAGARWPDPSAVVAEDVFDAFNSPGDTIRVGIESIVVSGDTMELRLVMTPEVGGDGARVWDLLGDGPGISVRLIDRAHLKEYRVLRTSGGDSYQPSDQTRFVAGQSLGFPIFYAAPEDDIDVVDVQLSSGLPIFEDVPLMFED